MSEARIQGSFIDGSAGRLLVVEHLPRRPSDRAILVVPPFGEEMNKARRLVMNTASALAEAGCRVIVPDLYGTGDSEGEFVDARWETWIDDLSVVMNRARSQGIVRFGALLIRLGAALFQDAESVLGSRFDRIVAWEPVTRGSEVLRYLIRMKTLAMRMAGGASQSAVELQQAILEGTDPIELGGYLVSPALARAVQGAGFDSARTTTIDRGLIIEFSAVEKEDAGSVWQEEALPGEKFWLVVEPGENSQLVNHTTRFLVDSHQIK